MVEGQHDGATRGRIKNLGQAIFHPPVKIVGPFKEKGHILHRHAGSVILRFSGISVSHGS